jgi:cell pole-organizing protein PopZ
MSAPNAQAVHGKETMTEREAGGADKAREPSMEDILASIRQIIAGDPPSPLAARSSVLPPLVRPAIAPAAMFPLRATLQPGTRASAHVEPPPSPPVPEPDFGSIDAALNFDELPETAVATSPMPQTSIFAHAAPPAQPPQPEPAPMSSLRHERDPAHRRAEPVASRQAAIAEAGSDPLISAAAGASVMSSFNTLAATMMMQNMPPLEDIAREMLRPILKAWLDDNLPVLVERLVRAEIERVSRGR